MVLYFFFYHYFFSAIITRSEDIINHYVTVVVSTIFVSTDSDIVFAKKDVVFCVCVIGANDDVKL